jgi:hypothetical protein
MNRSIAFVVPLAVLAACSSHSNFGNPDGGDDSDGGVAFTKDGGPKFSDTGVSDAPTTGIASCSDAAAAKSYVGCDYWPTVTGNNVWSIFDYAVVVANAGYEPADVTITGPNSTNQTGTVAPGSTQKFYLPWVTSLKGPDSNGDGAATAMTASVLQKGGAYHLVSSVPVSVYQFNALEYKPAGGPQGKDWNACPNDTAASVQCFSYSNDASLLLPSTAMTNNYRVMGQKGWSSYGTPLMGPSFTVTATANGTVITVKTSPTSQILAGGAIPAQTGTGQFNVALDAGDVAEFVGQPGDQDDFSGSLVTAQDAQHPVQVITSLPCIDQPTGTPACDHIEESVFPAETLGQHYVVTVPTGPHGNVVGHIVRIFGNVDGTTLTYNPSKPSGCPTTLNAGDVVDCGQVANDFEVKGNNAFGVFSGMLGGQLLDPGNYSTAEGDPSQSFSVAVEQYRTAYVFLAPSDYDTSYVDVVGPPGANVTIDGSSIGSFTPIGSSGYGVVRYQLGVGNAGAHSLQSDKPVGIQVMGYGQYTSYQYPGGSDLQAIAPPPVK